MWRGSLYITCYCVLLVQTIFCCFFQRNDPIVIFDFLELIVDDDLDDDPEDVPDQLEEDELVEESADEVEDVQSDESEDDELLESTVP